MTEQHKPLIHDAESLRGERLRMEEYLTEMQDTLSHDDWWNLQKEINRQHNLELAHGVWVDGAYVHNPR